MLCKRLRELPFVGIVDRFEAAVTSTQRNLRFAFPDIEFSVGTAR
ncbi:hypothetical protein ACU4GD_45150 [Cupriavidus basilensis]